MEENEVKKSNLDEIETSQLKELLQAEQIVNNALVMYGKRKFGFRPIEDQSPFIDREIFCKEMIVETMETSYGKPM